MPFFFVTPAVPPSVPVVTVMVVVVVVVVVCRRPAVAVTPHPIVVPPRVHIVGAPMRVPTVVLVVVFAPPALVPPPPALPPAPTVVPFPAIVPREVHRRADGAAGPAVRVSPRIPEAERPRTLSDQAANVGYSLADCVTNCGDPPPDVPSDVAYASPDVKPFLLGS